MSLHNELGSSLKKYLCWNKSRLDCFVGMLLALLRLKHINLTQLALAFGSQAAPTSNYRRLQRFFAEVVFDYDAIADLMMGLFDFQERPYYLTLDRTNWQWGKIDINILTLAVVYRGAAIPVYWLILNKRGNSNQRERIALLSRFLRQFGRQQLLGVLADREFIGGDWWQWLSDQQIPFVIRVKENQCLLTVRGQKMALSARFQDLRPRESRCLRKACQVSQHKVWLSGMRLSSGELLILAANQYVKDPFAVYALRWEIENLFQNLKGRGFHLEETRLTRYFRIKKVMALLAIAFAWAHKVGEWKDKVIKPLTVKKHGRLAQSLFRYGLDHLTHCLLQRSFDPIEALRAWVLFWWPPNCIVLHNGIPTLEPER